MEQILSWISWISLGTVLTMIYILWCLWILYVAMMNIDRARNIDQLPWQAKIMVYPTVALFDIVELIANVIVCTPIFFDLPREVTVSDRLRRYAADPTSAGKYRMTLVNFVRPMLDPFDPDGPHI